MEQTARADKWLWAVRLYKTRRLAADMCEAGKVKRGNHVIKASTLLRHGDLLELPFPEGPGSRVVEVLGLIDKRVAASQACDCYLESTPQENSDAQKRWHQARAEGSRGRPTKKDRRELNRIRGFFD